MKSFLEIREAWETKKGIEQKRKANTDVEEAKEHPAYNQLMTLATKMGNQKNRDARAVQVLAGKIANFTSTGNRGMMQDMAKAMKALDASSQAAVVKILNKVDPSLTKSINFKMAGMKEEVELEEANLSKVSTDKLKKMIRQAEDERVSPAFAMQVRAARAELKKRGESMKESEEFEETRKYTPPTKAEIEADKKKDNKGKPRPSMSVKSITKKLYGK